MRKIRVALVGAFPPQQKGEANYLGTYVRHLAAANDDAVEVAVVAQECAARIPTPDGVEVVSTYADRSKEALSFARLDDFVRAVKAAKPDVAHLQYGPGRDYGGRIGEPLAPALAELRAAGIRTFLTLHSLWLPEHVRDAARGAKLPAIADPFAVWYFRRHMRALRGAVDQFNCLVSGTPSPMTASLARAYGLSSLDDEVHGCTPCAKPLPNSDVPVVFAFGFIRPDKGLHVLVDAFERFIASGGKAFLRIAGRAQDPKDEAYARDIAERVAALGHHAEIVSSYIDDALLAAYLDAASLVVIPYLRNIGASGPLHHAMGFGRPIIATRIGHNVALEGQIPLVPPGDAPALASELHRILDDPAALARESARLCDIAKRRSWEALVADNLLRYKGLAA